jgi:hypothetical protein
MSAAVSVDSVVRRVLVWKTKKANPTLSAPEIARLVHQPVTSVRRHLKYLEVAPKELLEAYGHDAVRAWLAAVPIAAMKGDHRPAKDLLLHARAIEPVQLQGQTSIAIIFAGAPSVPGLQSSSDNDGPRVIANDSCVIDASVTDTSQSAIGGAGTPARDPAPTPANNPGNFSPQTAPVELAPVQVQGSPVQVSVTPVQGSRVKG